MLPVIPFDLLVPLALSVTVGTLALVCAVFVRRLLIEWYGRGGERKVEEAERLLLGAATGNLAPGEPARWVRTRRPGPILAFQQAALNLARRRDRFREWLDGSDAIEPLVELLERGEDQGSLLRRLRGRILRWARVAAAETLGKLRIESALDGLARAVSDSDREVAYAAASALARTDDTWAATVILREIGHHEEINNSRLAALVESMTCDVTEVLERMLEREEPRARYWALTLIGRKKIVELIEEVRPHLDDDDGNVRTAAVECVGELAVPLTDYWLVDRLGDEEWYVRSHAARALGKMGASWAADSLAEMLRSAEWWVRANAVDALVDLGPDAWDAVEEVLVSDDRFARNSAVEVLARAGWTDPTVERAAEGSEPAYRSLIAFGMSGGLGHLENALFRVDHEAVPLLLELLREIGDDATYGRIRAARETYPEELEKHALQVADTLRTS